MTNRTTPLMAASLLALAVAAPTAALAGGLAVREQSTQFQGTSFAGSGAGGGLSSSFWNSAAIGEAGSGLSTDSSYSLIFGQTNFTALPGTVAIGGARETDQDGLAFVGASYAAYRLNERTVFGVAINAPFGLSSKVDDQNWVGRLHDRSAKLITANVNPMMSYELMRGLHVGFGFQFQYAKLTFKTANSAAASPPSATLIGDDVGAGFTAGVLWKPAAGTSIGLGYRSAVQHSIDGKVYNTGLPQGTPFQLGITTPDMVTLSLRQSLSAQARLLATVEWAHWDRLNVHPVKTSFGTISNFDFRWKDGWHFALGGEYDLNSQTTLRAGAAYEISPVDEPSQRLPQAPDADRIWLSAGMTYKLSPTTTLSAAYSHIFIDDSQLNRRPANGAAAPLIADVESSVDIISLGYTMKWGGAEDRAPLK